MSDAVRINELGVYYPDFKLWIERYNIPKGYVTGLIGKNGAGKSTFIRSMLNISERYSGDIEILDMNFKENDIALKNAIGYVNDRFVFPMKETSKRIGEQLGVFYTNFDTAMYKQLLKQHQIEYTAKFSEMSKGMLAKFQIIFALSHHPSFVVLDEPTANLDPISRKEILDLLYSIMDDEEQTILFSTHITSDLDKIADYITLIDEGRIEFTLSKDELQEEYQIMTSEDKEVVRAMKDDLRGIIQKDGYYEALCTATSKYKHINTANFRKANIEDIMIYWEIHHE